jgi:hypothetical protein
MRQWRCAHGERGHHARFTHVAARWRGPRWPRCPRVDSGSMSGVLGVRWCGTIHPLVPPEHTVHHRVSAKAPPPLHSFGEHQPRHALSRQMMCASPSPFIYGTLGPFADHRRALGCCCRRRSTPAPPFSFTSPSPAFLGELLSTWPWPAPTPHSRSALSGIRTPLQASLRHRLPRHCDGAAHGDRANCFKYQNGFQILKINRNSCKCPKNYKIKFP